MRKHYYQTSTTFHIVIAHLYSESYGFQHVDFQMNLRDFYFMQSHGIEQNGFACRCNNNKLYAIF